MTLILLLALAIFTSLNLVTAQVITTPCMTSMINTITPCANFITGSINNGLTPSATCCDSFLSLITTSVDCACLLVSANVPLQIPVNRVLALFLPQACNVGQMPALCKASASPLPAPVSNTIFEVEAPKSEILQPALAPASVESTPMKQKHPRKSAETSCMGWKAAEKLIRRWKILRGDNVMITRGKDKGETGIIKRVICSQNRVIVEGKNLVKKHIKQGQGHKGGIFTVEDPLHASNVQVLNPVTGVSRGIGASGFIVPRPKILKIRTTPRPTVLGPKDTPMNLVLEKTYDAKTGRGMPEL
ncbi:hypothetical protein JHK86_026884 [Glycine max]|nr:hypothetical protein JHK86_026884 [Glycine max]